MILYISSATAYPIYDRLFQSGKIRVGYQMQKFNSNIISGFGACEDVTALANLPYEDDVSADKLDETIDGIRYVCIRNVTGALHRPANILGMLSAGADIIRKKRPRCIVCDAFSMSPCLVSRMLGKLFRIPVVGIITDLPEVDEEKKSCSPGMARLQGFDGYILLTRQMDEVVNPKGRPSMVMEGLSAMALPELREKSEKQTILYTGSLWKELAGIEMLAEGFCRANIPNAELHFYGTGELEPWLAEQSRRNPAVRYMGCVTNEEIVKRQCEAALLVNPRPTGESFCRYSFPSKTIEYMASGTPVLMTRLPGVPEEYFDYVFTIDEETPEGVEKKLKAFFEESPQQRQTFGAAARQFVKENKSCAAQCQRMLQFLDALTGTRR